MTSQLRKVRQLKENAELGKILLLLIVNVARCLVSPCNSVQC